MAKKAEKRKIDDWRVAAEPDAQGTQFDELVVGDWLHLERMDTRVWWMRIGECHINVSLNRDGTVKSITVSDWDNQLRM